FANNVAGHELRRVLEHVNEAVQLAQDIVWNMLRCTRFTVQIDGDLGIAKPQFADERAQILDRLGNVLRRIYVEFLIVDRQNERARAALLLGEGAQVAITGDAQDLHALRLDGGRQRPDTETRGVLGTVVFIDDDDGKTKLHA